MISLRDVVTGFGNRDPLAEVWRRNLRDGVGEITGVLPLRYIGNGRPLTDYLISGNTIQDGTPTPDAPVDAVGCGTDTANGYKLPLTVNGTEYPIYLGTVPTTRKIKKLALTGEENWVIDGGLNGLYSFVPDIAPYEAYKDQLCSHFQLADRYSQLYYNDNLFGFTSGVAGRLIIHYNAAQTADAFKQYLAAQYTNGTPVTVWYVLAEPETAVVNEPLMKIGDYADTISFAQAGVTIPTVSGANVLDMTSTAKPSEVYIKGRGIKPTGYGQLVDKNNVRILDKNGTRIFVHGQ